MTQAQVRLYFVRAQEYAKNKREMKPSQFLEKQRYTTNPLIRIERKSPHRSRLRSSLQSHRSKSWCAKPGIKRMRQSTRGSTTLRSNASWNW
ncbi:MAG: hypothetical protein STSR0009_21180 [Methanoregula sp.]